MNGPAHRFAICIKLVGPLRYFSKRLVEDKKIGDFEFDYDPSEGIFKFISDDEGIIVKATPFYNDNSGFPIEVFDEDQAESHIFMEQRNFNVEEILFEKYKEIMTKFLVEDFDPNGDGTGWIKKVNKFCFVTLCSFVKSFVFLGGSNYFITTKTNKENRKGTQSTF